MASIKKLLTKQSGLFGPGGKNMEKETYQMMVSNLESIKHFFPSRASAHPKLCGTSLQVHSNTSGAAQWGQLRSPVSVSPLTGSGTEEPLLPSAGFARLGLARAARWGMSVGVPFLTSCPQWDWHSPITGEKLLLPHDSKTNVFIRRSPNGRRQQLWDIAGKKSSGQSPAALAGLAPSLVSTLLQPLTGTFLFALWSELRVSKMESQIILPLRSPRCCRALSFQVKKMWL